MKISASKFENKTASFKSFWFYISNLFNYFRIWVIGKKIIRSSEVLKQTIQILYKKAIKNSILTQHFNNELKTSKLENFFNLFAKSISVNLPKSK